MSIINDTKSIQRHIGVKDDGIYGPVTAAKLRAHLANARSLISSDKIHSPRSAKYYKFDDRTERNLQTLSPAAQTKFRPFIARAQAVAAAMGYDYRAISGDRSYKKQNELYAKGRTKPGKIVTNARGGYSNHNFKLALDFGVFKGSVYVDKANPKQAHRVHAAIGQLAADYGIEWGGNWRSFKDTPHFEVKTSLSMSAKRKLTAAGKDVAAS